MEAFHEEHPEYTRGLLSYTLEYIVANTWPTNSLANAYNDCDMICDVGQTEPCGCTCTADPYDWSDDEVGRDYYRTVRNGVLSKRTPWTNVQISKRVSAEAG